jgi:ketopantoate reductase
MKTAIMGAGAMGSLFGGLLALSGEDVWLVDIGKITSMPFAQTVTYIPEFFLRIPRMIIK